MGERQDVTFLRTKVQRPRWPMMSYRVHALGRLEQGRGNPITLVSTPAGYGKSTLLSSWLAASGGRTASQEITSKKDQYTIWQILGIWLAGGVPLWIFGWVVHPALSQGLSAMDRGLLWMKLDLIALVWQFVLSMLILYREEGDIWISTIRRRFWLNNPISPRTGQKDNRLWWLLIPLMLVVVALELGLAPFLNDIWTTLFPFLAEPLSRSLDALFAPEMHAR